MDGIDIIKMFEGCRLAAYSDPGTGGAPITIGYGCTRNANGGAWNIGDMITMPQADALLVRDFNEVRAALVRDPSLAVLPAQCIGALSSLAFNIGAGTFMRSKCCAAIKAGDLKATYANWDWISAGGKPMRGLALRRAVELALFLQHWDI